MRAPQTAGASQGSAAIPSSVGSPDDPDGALRYRLLRLQDEHGHIPDNAWVTALEQKKQMPHNQLVWPHEENLQNSERHTDKIHNPDLANIEPNAWSWLGPGNIGGRVRSILIHPTNPSIMWAGAVSGGIWKTTNGGQHWFPLNDFLPSLAISCMAMDPSNPNVLYAGTGESAGSQSYAPGAGIFKSMDGGETWFQLTSTTDPYGWRHINRIAINPSNGQVILAATSGGILRSTNGGASWSYTFFNTTMDVNFSPSNGNRAIAGSQSDGAAYYSFDGGINWSRAAGLPGTGRVEIAYAPNNPSIVYASVDANGGELYRSTDGGQSYVLRNTGNTYFRHSPGDAGSQGWYDNAVWVDPTNSNVVIVGGIDLWRSTDGGATIKRISRWWDAPNSAHADQHFIVEHPFFNGSTNMTVYFGNDGGVYRTDNVYTVVDSTGWIELNNNLGITQFYGAAGNAASGRIIGGTQDNGTLRYTGGTESWNTAAGGDGGECAFDPTDPNYFYGEYQYLGLHRSTDGGATGSHRITAGLTDAEQQTAMFVAPFVLDPNNPNTLIAGGASLWRSTNVKASTPNWTVIKPYNSNVGYVTAIAVAKGNSNVVWLAHSSGQIYFTTNGTATTPSWTRVDQSGFPYRFPTSITIDTNNHSRVFVTFGGFRPDNVWRTTNGGQTWTNLSSNLPEAPVYTFAMWHRNPNWLYVGTEIGVFATSDGGATWSPSNTGPANTAVDELFWMNDTLVAATHGRGLYKITVTDNNSPPTVSITNISSGSFFPALSSIPISANASDSDGSISRVDFYANNSLIGSVASAPYKLTWSNVPVGAYELTARATDNAGALTTSSPISVIVYTPYTISGRLADESGNSLAGVTMSLTRDGNDYGTRTTDAGGNYSFANLPSGNYVLTLALAGYSFSPASRSFANLNADVTADFTGTNRINVALSVNGATATASSTFGPGYPASAALDGDRRGLNWGNGGGWADATPDGFPDWIEVSFSGGKSINEIVVFMVQDDRFNPIEPFDSMTSTLYGLTDFVVQYWDGVNWQPVPGGSVVANNKVKRRFTFQSLITNKIRVFVNFSNGNYSRLTEIEAYASPPPAGLHYYPLPAPLRLLDTRPGQPACDTPGAPLTGGVARTQSMLPACVGIPAGAQALVGNVTVVNSLTPSAPGFVTLYPAGAPRPNASSVNYEAGGPVVVNNQFTVGFSGGAFNIYAQTTTHLVVDIIGYYAPPGSGGLYYHQLPAPVRLLDTRPGQPACDTPGTPLTGGVARTQSMLPSCAGIPAGARALVGNATVINTLSPRAPGFVTLYPNGAARPNASSINYEAGGPVVVNNSFAVGLDANNSFNIYALTGTHFVVDLIGYFSDQALDVNGSGLLYHPLPAPTRLLDTRPGQAACDASGVNLTGGITRMQAAVSGCTGIPAQARGVIGNVAVINNLTPSAPGFVTFYPAGAVRPNVSNVNYEAGGPVVVGNSLTVGLGGGAFDIFALTSTHLVTDLIGYYAPATPSRDRLNTVQKPIGQRDIVRQANSW